MTQKGLDSLMSSSMKLGGDVSITVGPTGASSGATVTGDLVVYTRSKGLYGGVNVDGAVVKPSDDLNAAYYGHAASPIDIVVKDSVKHNKADDAPLLTVVGKPTK
jgi:lipid-binding SYLF domain-containing protein